MLNLNMFLRGAIYLIDNILNRTKTNIVLCSEKTSYFLCGLQVFSKFIVNIITKVSSCFQHSLIMSNLILHILQTGI